VADARRALSLYDALPGRSGEDWFETACCHATLATLAGKVDTAVPATESQREEDAAMAHLNRAASMGYRAGGAYRTEDALEPLRGRDDFRLLMMDVTFPAAPFAR
jgi:hypothetical protein